MINWLDKLFLGAFILLMLTLDVLCIVGLCLGWWSFFNIINAFFDYVIFFGIFTPIIIMIEFVLIIMFFGIIADVMEGV